MNEIPTPNPAPTGRPKHCRGRGRRALFGALAVGVVAVLTVGAFRALGNGGFRQGFCGTMDPAQVEKKIDRVAGWIVEDLGGTPEQQAKLAAIAKAAAKDLAPIHDELAAGRKEAVAILTAKEMNPNLYIISRAEEEGGEKRMLQAGADRVVALYRLGGQKVANGILRPCVNEYLELTAGREGRLALEEITIPVGSPLCGMTLKDARLRQRSGISIVAIIPAGGTMDLHPHADTIIEAGATLVGLGPKEDFANLEKVLMGSR